MNSSKAMQRVVHLDEKILKPEDRASSGTLTGSRESNASLKEALRPNGLLKSVVGKPKIYDMKGNLLAEEDNLVVLKGREYLAQLIAQRAPVSAGNCPNETPINGVATSCDYTKYKITHFAVGDAGTDGSCPPVASGPYDNDINLANPKELFPQPTAVAGLDYLHMDAARQNTLKRIEHDGSIEIVSEEHTINLADNGEETVQAFTAIRYTMYLNPGESTDDPAGGPNSIPFKFNEAGLYGIEYDAGGDPVVNAEGAANYLLFARFTTLDKYLEESDGIMIEWYVLV